MCCQVILGAREVTYAWGGRLVLLGGRGEGVRSRRCLAPARQRLLATANAHTLALVLGELDAGMDESPDVGGFMCRLSQRSRGLYTNEHGGSVPSRRAPHLCFLVDHARRRLTGRSPALRSLPQNLHDFIGLDVWRVSPICGGVFRGWRGSLCRWLGGLGGAWCCR